MEEKELNLKEKKKLRKAKRKAVRPWKALTFISLPLAIISVIAMVVATVFDNTVAIFFGGTFWKLKNATSDARYFTPDFQEWEDNVAYGRRIAEQVEAEGAALLYNKDSTLPLAAGAKVSLFSNSSVNPIYGGTGSGNIDASEAESFKDAMEHRGFEVNETLWEFYESGEGSHYARQQGGVIAHASQVVSEVPWEMYTDRVKDTIKGYGDAAIVMLSRVGGEGVDLDFTNTNYLELDKNERDMLSEITKMKQSGDVQKIIVLINSANALQMDFMQDESFDIDAVLWIGDVGLMGTTAVSKILSGEVNPSGSLVDTYVYDNYSAPAMKNFVATRYEGATADVVPEKASYYMIYQEGIYVGYRYYETRYEDYVMGTGNAGAYDYGNTVAYPFGHGLSYTDFAYSDLAVAYEPEQDQFVVSVTVTNTGSQYAGKETVQLYLQSPYTSYDIMQGVEKASVKLCGFEKTGILAPGESETLTMYVDRFELASYDSYGERTYIVDEGVYYFAAAANAHDAVNHILADKGYTPETTEGRMDADGNPDLVYAWTEEEFDATTYSMSDTGAVVTNQLDDADLNMYVGSPTQITYLSRNNWEGTFPTEIVQLSLTDHLIEDLQNVQYDPNDYETVDMPVLGADNDRKLIEMRGLSYGDPAWNSLLDQLSFEEMCSMIADGFHWNMPAKSVEAPGTRDENGPQGLTTSLLKTELEAIAFSSEDVMAATFNRELIYEVGKCIGNDCLHAGVSFLYGTGNNIHRTPYGGRNFEYYAEDGFLSGEICAAEVAGMKELGVEVLMKHFALNDSEAERIGLGVWLNEQSAREIYLKAFQTPVEDADANGVMVAYTRFGATWSGGHYGLITGILREEWGCEGKIITDNALHEYVNPADFVMAGGSIMDAMLPTQLNMIKEYENDTVVVSAMKEAAHRNLYAVVNSNGMNGVGPETTVNVLTPWPIWLCRGLAAGFSILFVTSAVMWYRKAREYQEKNKL
ncbi:MAG: glycoside hydrolase family 3 C-terminal domain-containing protein [Lachnospiraceae bacterium]|nr:glycoside hydrolase family 3 C-terminal domain-containing protein [Lachnospiraceae bacterium]